MKDKFKIIVRLWDDLSILVKDGDYTGAIEICDKLLLIESNIIEVYRVRGRLKSFIGNVSGAIDDIVMALEICPTDMSDIEILAELFHKSAEDLVTQKKIKDAIEDYSMSIALDSSKSDIYFKRAKAKFEVKDFDGGIDDFAQYVKISQGRSLDEKMLEDLKERVKNNQK